ncbi:hypothetical protein F2Q69_00004708 [Brassica cretica]|uniref:Uncharacterized protein n=1 Tax=Brassica cretica TaxID=69181 RepID=A0A8S9P788_BRACR|nr:hypothetical protein F2Q69_00004708 [Brassica cretica]
MPILSYASVSNMLPSYVLLANLKAGRCSNTAEVHLLRLWGARNVRKGGELMSVDTFLLDEQFTRIQGITNASRIDPFRHRLSEVFAINDSMLLLKGFDSVSHTLSLLSSNLYSTLQRVRELASHPHFLRYPIPISKKKKNNKSKKTKRVKGRGNTSLMQSLM